jgi:hypothetical protein
MANNNISTYIDQLISFVPNFENQNDAISKANIGWHMEHVFKVLINVTDAIKISKPEDFKSNFSFVRTLIFITKKIPRGKGRAPKSVSPSTNNTTQSLLESATTAKQKLAELYTLDANKHFNHPFFGNLKLNDCIKFLSIHTKHHLKIIEEINASHA